jgi:GAF domain-containing protein
MDYPIAENEAERLLALEQLGQLDSPAEERFDRLTRLVRDHFDVPYSMVTMLDRDRQWIKSCQGASVSESPREMSFCNYAIMQEGLFTIPDMKKDPRFVEHPLVVGPEQVRFYAGIPVHTPCGHRVGTLCILDDEPRQITLGQAQAMRDFGALVDSELQRQRLAQSEEILIRALGKEKARAAVDEETRMWNREHILRVLESEQYFQGQQGQALALAWLSFDAPAHADARAWSQVSQRIRRAVRPLDSVGRTGSSDFLLILPNTAKEQMSNIARRVLRTVATPTDKAAVGSLLWPSWLGLTTVIPGEKAEAALARASGALGRAREAEAFSYALAETNLVHGVTLEEALQQV